MSKKVVIILSTPVRGGKGNSEILCEEFPRFPQMPEKD